MPRSSPNIEIEFYLPEDEKGKDALGDIIGSLHGKYAKEILVKKVYDRKEYDEMLNELWRFWRKGEEG